MDTQKEICGAVRGYFSANKITMKTVAELLGVTSGAVTNQLAGRQFSTKMAKRYAEVFGFNEDYLLFGRGSLLGTNDGDGRPPASLEVPSQVAEMLNRMSATILSQQETIAILVRNGDATKKAGPRFPAKADPLIK